MIKKIIKGLGYVLGFLVLIGAVSTAYLYVIADNKGSGPVKTIFATCWRARMKQS